jgi:hypothetical protein
MTAKIRYLFYLQRIGGLEGVLQKGLSPKEGKPQPEAGPQGKRNKPVLDRKWPLF